MLRVVAFVSAVVCERMQQLPTMLAPTMLRVVAFVLAVVCKRMQQLPTLLAPTMLRVVAFVSAVVCERMQQLPTMLGPAVHYGKDPTHKTLETMCIARAWPQQCWKSCAYGSNIVFRSHAWMITEQKKCWELLAQKFDRFQPLRNHSQQHAKTYNNMQQGVKRTQHVTSHNVGSCWQTMLRPLARGFMNLLNATKKTSRREITSHEEGMSISFDRRNSTLLTAWMISYYSPKGIEEYFLLEKSIVFIKKECR